MLNAFTGFAVVGLAIVVGYAIGRTGTLGHNGSEMLGRLVFFALSPFLFFTVLEGSDLRNLFSGIFPVSALAALAVSTAYAAIAIVFWKSTRPETLVGSLSAGYVNSGNMGIPLSAYLLGDPAFSMPVILLQVVFVNPIALTLLESMTGSGLSSGKVLLRVIRNPALVASGLGIAVSLGEVELPRLILEPMEYIAAASIPVLLIAFGVSMTEQASAAVVLPQKQIVVASALKLIAMPLIAWLLGSFVFSLSREDVFIITFLAALPTAQTIFNFSQRYRAAEPLSRGTVLITTFFCVPVLLLIVFLLG